MDVLRAHHDPHFMGANPLRDEPNPEGRAWDYNIDDQELRIYRQDTLRLGRQKVLVLSGSRNFDLTLHIFDSPRVERGSSLLGRDRKIFTRSSQG